MTPIEIVEAVARGGGTLERVETTEGERIRVKPLGFLTPDLRNAMLQEKAGVLAILRCLPDSNPASEAPSGWLLGYVDEILTGALDGYGAAEYERDLRTRRIELPGVFDPRTHEYEGVGIRYARDTFTAGRCTWPEGLLRPDGLDESLFPPCREIFGGVSHDDLFRKFAIHVAVVHRAIPYGIGGSHSPDSLQGDPFEYRSQSQRRG